MILSTFLHVFLVVITVTCTYAESFACPDVPQCECNEERDWSDKIVKMYKVVLCEGTSAGSVLNLTSLRGVDISRIIIHNSSINHLYASTFADITVPDIEIRNTQMTIDEGALAPLRNSLRQLALERIGIHLKRGLDFIKDLVQLRSLVVDSDDTFPLHFPGHKFANMSLVSLRRLSLRYCNIAKISDAAFVGLEPMEILDLSGNNISSVPGAILILRNLRKLILSHNTKLYYIHDNAFVHLTRLEEIEMSHTHVHTVSQEAFFGLEKSLQTLIIDHSQLPDGHFVSMRNLEKLKKLDMSFNKIVFIHNESFEGLDTLEELDISGQFDIRGGVGLTVQFTDSMFRGLESNLRILRIRHLGLVSLPLAAIAPLTSLDLLDASDNEFTDIYDGFFDNVRARTLFLTHMGISDISADAFDGLKTPINIMFDSNNITNISFILDVKACAFGKLSFVDNPISCDCDVMQVSASRRVRDLIGSCDESEFAGEDLKSFHKISKATEMCDKPNYQSMQCGGTSSARIADSYNIITFLLGLISCFILLM